jgi:asparagine synthase (glutamine-hydrolysing)
MCRALRHRGPDEEGLWRQGPVCFGHRRLTILDLTPTGRQPMTDPSGQVVITYNGEVYNYLELRRELLARGHRFRGTSDTEVLLHAYLEWDTGMLERLNGMYAFGLYDFRQGRFFAARDPMGQKPFLYYRDAQGLVFASELWALARHPRVPREVDREALAHYLAFESYPAPHTALAGVAKLPPGHALFYWPGDDRLQTWAHWDPFPGEVPAGDQPPGEADLARLEETLRRAVERHLRADVPVGLYLSGGVDSTTMVILACDVLGADRVKTFTVAHSDPSFDESDQARLTARQLGTEHREFPLTRQQVLRSMPDILARLDEPLADPGLAAIYQVASFASRHVKVVISGDGGDEFFCGYEPFLRYGLAQRLARLPGWLLDLMRAGVELLPDSFGYMGLTYKARTFLKGLGQPPALRNHAWTASFTAGEMASLLVGAGELEALSPGEGGLPRLYGPLLELYRRSRGLDPLSRLGLEYQTFYLPYCICAHTDKANMMWSLEARAPFLDTEVMRLVRGMPSSFKLQGGEGKYILRRWIRRRLGREVMRKKQGFTVPLARWLRDELRPLARELLHPRRLAAEGLFHPRAVERLWRQHQQGRVNHYKKLWTLVTFQAWWARLRGEELPGLG